MDKGNTKTDKKRKVFSKEKNAFDSVIHSDFFNDFPEFPRAPGQSTPIQQDANTLQENTAAISSSEQL